MGNAMQETIPTGGQAATGETATPPFTFNTIRFSDLRAQTLRAAATGKTNVVCALVRMYNGRGGSELPAEEGELIFLPEEHRAALWIGNAERWTDCRSVEDALNRYVNGDMSG